MLDNLLSRYQFLVQTPAQEEKVLHGIASTFCHASAQRSPFPFFTGLQSPASPLFLKCFKSVLTAEPFVVIPLISKILHD